MGDCAWWLRKVSSAAVFSCLRKVVFVTCQAASDLQSQSTMKCQHQINFFVCQLWSQTVPSDTWWLWKSGKFGSEVVLVFWLKWTSEEILPFLLNCAIEESREMAQLCSWSQLEVFSKKNSTWKLDCPVISLNQVYFAVNYNHAIPSKPHTICLSTYPLGHEHTAGNSAQPCTSGDNSYQSVLSELRYPLHRFTTTADVQS